MKDLTYIESYRDTDTELNIYGAKGNKYNGCFKVFINGRSFNVIASDGGGWDHISATIRSNKRTPTWEEMCAIKDMFFEKDECVIQYHPPESDYVNIAENCLHLWRSQYVNIPLPPTQFV